MRSFSLFLTSALAFGLGINAHAATFSVTNTSDTGVGSLRAAINSANNTLGTDEIVFDGSVFGTKQTIDLNSQLSISTSLSIRGGTPGVTISGGTTTTVFHIDAPSVTLSNLTVVGSLPYNFSVQHFNGDLIVERCTFLKHSSGVIHDPTTSGTLTVRDSTFADGAQGVYSWGEQALVEGCTFTDLREYGIGTGPDAGTLTVKNSTVARCPTGIFANPNTNLLIQNCTIVENLQAGVVFPPSSSFSSLSNSIVAGNAYNVYTPPTSSSFNIIGGTVAAAGLQTSAGKALVADNGGLTPTIALEKSSPALNAGTPSFDATTTPFDQRGSGFARVVRGRVDIGAFELQNTVPVVTNLSITPVAPLTNDTLRLDTAVTNSENDALTYTYVWRKDGQVIVGATGPTLDLSQPGNGDDGDEITVTLTVNDGVGDSEPFTSAPVLVGNRAPSVVSISPRNVTDKVGNKRTFTVTASDPNGTRDVQSVWLLINERLSWVAGATFIYVPDASSPTNGLLYLRQGDDFLAPMQIGTGATPGAVLDNGAVRVVGSEIAVSVSGNSITLSLPLTIRDGLVGQNRVFGRVMDTAGATDPTALVGDSGYIRNGTYTVTPQFSGQTNSAPTLSKLTPESTYTALNNSGIAAAPQTFVFYVKDENGMGDVDNVWFMAGKQLNWTNSATFVYQPRTRRLFLRSDDGNSFLGGGRVGSAGIIENSQVRLDLSKVQVLIYPDGKSFGLRLPLQAKRGLLGQNKVWLRAQDRQGATAPNGDAQGYVQSGTWSVGQSTPAKSTASASAGKS